MSQAILTLPTSDVAIESEFLIQLIAASNAFIKFDNAHTGSDSASAPENESAGVAQKNCTNVTHQLLS